MWLSFSCSLWHVFPGLCLLTTVMSVRLMTYVFFSETSVSRKVVEMAWHGLAKKFDLTTTCRFPLCPLFVASSSSPFTQLREVHGDMLVPAGVAEDPAFQQRWPAEELPSEAPLEFFS